MKRIDNPPPLKMETEDIPYEKCPDCGSTEYNSTMQGRVMEARIKDGRVIEFCVDEFDLEGEYIYCAKCKRDLTSEVSGYFPYKYGDRFILKHIATERNE